MTDVDMIIQQINTRVERERETLRAMPKEARMRETIRLWLIRHPSASPEWGADNLMSDLRAVGLVD